MTMVSGNTGSRAVLPATLSGIGAPTQTFGVAAGQNYIDKSSNPPTLYEFNGTTWVSSVSNPLASGNFTLSNGNFVASTQGTGIVLNSPAATGAAASPVVVNGRSGRATFTSVSIAAAADLTLTITNSSITAASTQVIVSMSGATTGSALSIKSKTASSGSLAIVVTNGTGATTTTADIVIEFLVIN